MLTGDPGTDGTAENVDMATPIPDPLALPWPRRTARTTLRPLAPDDAVAMHSYRRLPEVCAYLSHGPLSLAEVEQRIAGRLSDIDPTPGRRVRGLAIEHQDRMVGDAMLRTQVDAGQAQLWIGYALHPDVWGHGLATEVAQELCRVGSELGLPVHADAFADNVASLRVLEKAGLARVGTSLDAGRPFVLFASVTDQQSALSAWP